MDDDNIIYNECLSHMVNSFTSKKIGYVIAPILYGDAILYPNFPFRFGNVDLLNYMVRRKLVEKIWGQNMHGCADLFLIQKISAISRGNNISKIIGHHR